jgi:hypothetical protein
MFLSPRDDLEPQFIANIHFRDTWHLMEEKASNDRI